MFVAQYVSYDICFCNISTICFLFLHWKIQLTKNWFSVISCILWIGFACNSLSTFNFMLYIQSHSLIKAFHFNAPHLYFYFFFFRQRNLYLVQGCEVLPMRRCASPMVNTGRVTFAHTFFAINLMKLSFLPYRKP